MDDETVVIVRRSGLFVGRASANFSEAIFGAGIREWPQAREGDDATRKDVHGGADHREASRGEVGLAQGMTVSDVLRKLGVTEQT